MNNLIKELESWMDDDILPGDVQDLLRACALTLRMKDKTILTQDKLLAALSTRLAQSAQYFYSGPEGYFYTGNMEDGERILALMNVDDADWTATEVPDAND